MEKFKNKNNNKINRISKNRNNNRNKFKQTENRKQQS